ncbi:MAG: radical SAM protein [Deltaproteobacteria bacterium]|nr:radical SAM protein [Deltaproteobacteria bacterium]
MTETFVTAASHWHPVERKPLYHYHPGMSVLTLAAPGCTFTCGYCQNWRVSQVGRVAGAGAAVSPVDPAAIVAEAAACGGGIALSYAEPALAAELTLALAAHARPASVPMMWKTNGFLTDTALDRLLPALDAVNVDLKAADEPSHRALTGAPLAPVLTAMRRLVMGGLWVEVSTPLLPGFNDDERSVRTMARVVAGLGPEVPWHLLRFQPEFRWKDRGPAGRRDRGAARGLRSRGHRADALRLSLRGARRAAPRRRCRSRGGAERTGERRGRPGPCRGSPAQPRSAR